MSTHKNYTHFIELVPLGDFFFGNESFSDKDNKSFYFQKSELFPQQTSILGMLRYQLLAQNKMLSVAGQFSDVAKAIFMVGEEGFNPEPNPEEGDPGFGLINQISPVMVCHKDELFFPFPKIKLSDEHTKSVKYQDPAPVTITGKALQNQSVQSIYCLENYGAKHGLEYGFRSFKGSKYHSHSEVYNTEIKEKIGIYKTDTLPYRQIGQGADQEGFFKQTYCRLNKGFSFGFYVSLSLTEKTNFTSTNLVYLGKERSAFQMKVRKLNQNDDFESLTQASTLSKGDLIWSISDARLDLNDIFTKGSGIVIDDISFRCHTSRIKNNFNYHEKPHRGTNTNRVRLSSRYNLLKKGSLIRVDDPNIIDHLFHYSSFYKIGFNHFIKLQ